MSLEVGWGGAIIPVVHCDLSVCFLGCLPALGYMYCMWFINSTLAFLF